ncbi:MAG TPA: CZB domain-containing protein, partial [bacterium]|nr:CZB domain-containing protein [bacterium]
IMITSNINLNKIKNADITNEEQNNQKIFLIEKEIDHLDWLIALNDVIINNGKFEKATDAHKCKFGEWYYNYINSDNFKQLNKELQGLFYKIEEPHKKLHESAITLLNSNNKIHIFNTETKKYLNEVRNILKEINKQIDLKKDELKNQKEKIQNQTKIIIGSIIILIILLTFILSFYLITLIKKSLYKVVETAQKIADGNLKQDRVVINTTDELALLGNVFNKMLGALNMLCKKAEDIAAGKIGAAEIESRMKDGTSLAAAAAAAAAADSDLKGDLADAFLKMQSQLRVLTVQANLIARDDLNHQGLNDKQEGELGEGSICRNGEKFTDICSASASDSE